MATTGTPKVYAAIVGVMEELAKEGISKERKNAQQGYNFRGIDDIYNALSAALVKCKLVMIPRIIERIEEERIAKGGGRLGYVTVTAEYDLVSSEDGSVHTARTYGEAMDSVDKATNKAMSAAYKYAALQVFCIPTEGDNDADGTTHVVEARQMPVEEPKAPELSNPEKANFFKLKKDVADEIKLKIAPIKLTDWLARMYDAGCRTTAELISAASEIVPEATTA